MHSPASGVLFQKNFDKIYSKYGVYGRIPCMQLSGVGRSQTDEDSTNVYSLLKLDTGVELLIYMHVALGIRIQFLASAKAETKNIIAARNSGKIIYHVFGANIISIKFKDPAHKTTQKLRR